MTGLEALNETVNKFADVILLGGHKERNATNLTNAIDYLERTPQIRTLRKCVKALEIIKKKKVDMWHLTDLLEQTYEMYLAFCKSEKYEEDYILTKEEFNLLKED